MGNKEQRLEIMDTTLRDGEQMRNVSYSSEEKLSIAKILLEDVKVKYIEIASARVSKGEEEAATKIFKWAKNAGFIECVEILGFIDINKSVDWIAGLGGQAMNLLSKGSLKHLTGQLKKTKEQHVEDIKKTVEYASKKGVSCNIYFEDWSNGMISSRDYVYYLLDNLQDEPINRYMLPDTLGILYPPQITEFITDIITRYPNLHFDFHGHNDYGVAVANTLAAVAAGANCIHCTINGMGERAGNAPLDEVVIGIHDFLHLKTGINEKQLFKMSQTVEIFSGCRIAFNKPISGHNVFTQTAGIHADGDQKGDLYVSTLYPERFNRKRQYALGKLSGKSNLDYNLEKMGIELNPDQKKLVLEKIVQLGDKKAQITEAELPYIIADVLETPQEKTFRLLSCMVVTNMKLKPVATVKLIYKESKTQKEIEIEESSQGDGGYDAFMNVIRKIAQKISFKLPKLSDYSVTIPPGGKTDALVQCSITWEDNNQRFVTKGVNSDQIIAAIEATEKMLNLISLHKRNTNRLIFKS
jgi:D-citramalate synthase